jgi:hypothetical protein
MEWDGRLDNAVSEWIIREHSAREEVGQVQLRIGHHRDRRWSEILLVHRALNTVPEDAADVVLRRKPRCSFGIRDD